LAVDITWKKHFTKQNKLGTHRQNKLNKKHPKFISQSNSFKTISGLSFYLKKNKALLVLCKKKVVGLKQRETPNLNNFKFYFIQKFMRN